MNNFNYYNPTKIFFGENSIENLSEQLKAYGENILLTYGGGSIKRNGIYPSVIKILKNENKNVFELSGIMSNPRKEKVYEGIKICKENNIDFILAIGGGSVIDCSKAISAGSKIDRDFWKAFFINNEECYDATPLGVILTIPATGSEMNLGSVVTDWEKNLKIGYMSKMLYPKFSILDPTYTYTLPKEQTIYGSIDILAHVFEQYFSEPNDSNLSYDLSEAIIKNVIENLEIVLLNPTDYIARSNLMWCSTMALNGVIGLGKNQDWTSHQIEHSLSAFYDIPHGAGLAIVFPSWMKYVYKHGLNKFVRYAINVWGVDIVNKTDEEIALEGIEKTKEYFVKIGAPITLTEVGIPKEDIDRITEKVFLPNTGYMKMTKEDVKNILIAAI
ncbi:iron-containing alcohol dehydrogenase [Clostridium cibarium]|uniref:Iron-containing alcohol dehydrogenase n=1 Tax=Clostridium cibarium TaxID=2762247 RepID=A0ABR8PWG0_9CLOT|nr:iron-containing alcohol dehydrogenase [Clostridium cibarium]MBD7912516.1 iron-containing alcohol dehydrogenase [Clostridium cibarium]